MLPVMLLDLLFVGASVYLILNDQIVPGIAMLLMGSAATGILVMRFVLPAMRERSSSPGLRKRFGGASVAIAQVSLDPADEAAVRETARRSKIEAIKQVRELTGVSLRSAKEYVDRLG